jgi:hypothetical protein
LESPFPTFPKAIDTGASLYRGVTFGSILLQLFASYPHKSGKAAALTISIFGASPLQRAIIAILIIVAVAVAIVIIIIIITAMFSIICAFCANWNYRIT